MTDKKARVAIVWSKSQYNAIKEIIHYALFQMLLRKMGMIIRD